MKSFARTDSTSGRGRVAFFGLALILFSIAGRASSQVEDGSLAQTQGSLSELPGSGAPVGGETSAPPAPTLNVGPGGEPLLERPIEGSGYVLGPGDVLGLTVQGTIQRFSELPVTPEGSVLIPGASEVRVAGRTLEEARQAIREEVGNVYRNVRVFVTLLRLRRFTIFVLGQVKNPGQYTASPVDRVSEGIRLSGGLLPDASDRSIRLQRQDDTEALCDLLRFRRTGDLAANPNVRDGDVILVDYRKEGVLLSGAVNEPGEFEYLEGDSIGTLIDLAGGLTEQSTLDSVEVARFEPGQLDPTVFYLAAETPEEERAILSFRVQQRDAVLIRAQPDWDIRHTVEIKGEVTYPGVYVIDEDVTTLSEIIHRAGGFTPEASLREATVLRKVDESIKDAEFERLRTVPTADMSPTEYEYFKMRSRQRLGLMTADFALLFEEGDPSQDILLKDGDLIQVPSKKAYVTLSGQVVFPGNIRYEPGLTVDNYIELGGGFAWKAARGRTVVIRAQTGEWIPKERVRLVGPGDTIWVPEKPDRDWYAIFKESLTIISQLATVYLVVRSSI